NVLAADIGGNGRLRQDFPGEFDRVGEALDVVGIAQIVRLDERKVRRVAASKLHAAHGLRASRTDIRRTSVSAGHRIHSFLDSRTREEEELYVRPPLCQI